LPRRLKAWLRTLRIPRGPRRRVRDVGAKIDHFVEISERLEKGLEELKDLQWQIRESEGRYRDLLDTQADVILRRDAQGRLTFVNRAFCRVFGLERSAVLGQPFRPRILAGDKVGPLAPGAEVRERRTVQEIETAAGPRWFEWEEHAVPAEKGAVPEVQSVGRDVTEARRARTELTDARAQAEAANRAKSRFLAAMSHEIRTPMNGILGMVGLLGETEMTAEQQTYRRAIDRSARQLLTLIDEILDFSKIEANRLVLKSEPFVIADCVQSVVELLAPKAYEKGIDIAWAVHPDLPRTLRGDEVRVRQVLTNLVGNSIKFTDTGGVLVTVGAQHEAGRPASSDEVPIAITVEDTGIGIEPNALPFLFSEFEQTEAAVRRRQGGTGLGLAISRRLARAMGGDIRVASEANRGSTFTALLRLRRASAPDTRPPPPLLDRHVLLALERPLERRALSLALEGANVPVEHGPVSAAGDIIDAACEAQEPFTSLLVDGNRGAEAAGRLLMRARAAAKGNEVLGIVVLDTGAKADFMEFQQAGYRAYLLRPVRPQSLLEGIRAGFAEPPPPAPALPACEPRRHGNSPDVLLVEDNDVNALVARRMLEKAGCGVRLARNGREAVEVFRRMVAGAEEPVDLVLMDLHMPVMDGIDATRAIREVLEISPMRAPPIIAVTANAFEEDRRLCLEAGMDDYLAKPFEREDLHRLLDRWCGGEGSEQAA
jgi:PAS domain S-box-containing protein